MPKVRTVLLLKGWRIDDPETRILRTGVARGNVRERMNAVGFALQAPVDAVKSLAAADFDLDAVFRVVA